ncbi:hypothetical protein ACMHYB_60510 [Sorangium sp. So ce1128]
MIQNVLDREDLASEEGESGVLARQMVELLLLPRPLPPGTSPAEVWPAVTRELGCPVIPLLPGMLLVPLIGMIDGGRAQQVLEKVTEAAGRWGEPAVDRGCGSRQQRIYRARALRAAAARGVDAVGVAVASLNGPRSVDRCLLRFALRNP